MTKDLRPDPPDWPCELPDFVMLGSRDTLALGGGGEHDDGDYLIYPYPPGLTVGHEIPPKRS